MNGLIKKRGGAVLACALLIAVSGPAIAGGKGKGPRASMMTATVCKVEGTSLHVTARLTNISSGKAIPDVISSTFTGLAKTSTGNWDGQQVFDMADGDIAGLVHDFQDIHATLDLCRLKDLGILGLTKAVNVGATINYDRDSGGDPKQIDNMCGDDPTTDAIEPEGIPLTAEMVHYIEMNCF